MPTVKTSDCAPPRSMPRGNSCDDPPNACHYGTTNTRKHLQELGAPEPQLPPFDESNFEPMLDEDLNPRGGFWVDPDRLDSQ